CCRVVFAPGVGMVHWPGPATLEEQRMTVRRVVVRTDPRTLADGLGAIRTELELPSAFPPAVLADADESVRRGPSGARADRTDVHFVTIDPPGSMDLDQAMALERTPD